MLKIWPSPCPARGRSIRVPRPRLGSFPGKTLLMDFESAPFPYDGKNPTTGKPFFNVFYDGRFGRRGARGQVYWENETYTDPRVMLHIPKGFDIRKPAVIVVYFHGHGAKIDRDVRDRQQVAAQITRSDANAVVVAPQFAVDAAEFLARRVLGAGLLRRIHERSGRAIRADAGPAENRAHLLQDADHLRQL